MAQIVLGVTGAVVGGWVGGPVGAQIGWALGSAIGGSMAPAKKIQGPTQSLTDLKILGTEWGQCIPYARGTIRMAGQVWWNTDRRPTYHTTVTEEDGKGGGGTRTETTTITYDMDMLIGLTGNPIFGIKRIWMNGELVYNLGSDADDSTLLASGATAQWARLTVYTGADAQLPDPTYEAAVGTANAPAYRGRGSVFIAGLQLGESGQVPNFTFEVVVDGGTILVYTTREFVATADSQANSIAATGTGSKAVLVSASAGPGAKYSTNEGVTWQTASVLPTPEFWGATCWTGADDGINPSFAAVTSGVTLTATYSIDGDVWVTSASNPFGTSPNAGLLRGIAANGSGRLVAVGKGRAMYSTDYGVTWTNSSAGLPVWGFGGIAFGAAVFCAVAQATVGGASGSTVSATSADGITWSTGTLPSVQQWCAVAWNGSVFCAISGGLTANAAATSSDGLTWTARTLPLSTNWSSIAADSHGVFCAVSSDNSQFAYSSDDGVTWTQGSSSRASFDICVVPSGFLASDNGGTNVKQITRQETVESISPTVEDVVSELCLRAELTAGQFDVTALSSISRDVLGFAISQLAPTRSILELLKAVYFFEDVSSDKVYFRPRGAASVLTVPYLDLGAATGDEHPDGLPLRQGNDLELPAQIAITYFNASDDYENDTQYSDRLISAVAGTIDAKDLAIVMMPSEAKAVADTMSLDQKLASVSASIALLGTYARLEPTDPFTVTGADGATFRVRAVRKTDSFPLLTFETVLESIASLTSPGITSDEYEPTNNVDLAAPALMELMDIPILLDANNDGGFYVAAKGDGTPYPGAVIFNSVDNVSYTRRATILESAVFGDCTTTLGNWTGPRVFDEVNSVTVDVGDGTAVSTTRDAILNDQNLNLWLIGSEILQAQIATIVSPGVFTLSSLLRGGRGTEWAMTGHAAGERAVLLRSEGMERIVLANSELGLSRYYKASTLGRPLSEATAETFTDNAIGLKPFSPAAVRGVRDASNNVVFTVQRRTRMVVRKIGALGISVPLGEAAEAFELDVYASGAYAAVLRTLYASGPDVEYTAAQQTADGLTPGNLVFLRAHQISTEVGRGYKLETSA